MRRSLRSALALMVGISVSAGFVAYVGPGRILEAFSGARADLLVLAFLAYALYFLTRGLRWQGLLRLDDTPVRLVNTTSLTATGWLVSTFVPLKAGDVARAGLLAKRERADLARVAGTVVLERALDLLGLALAASIGFMIAAFDPDLHLPLRAKEALLLAWILPPLALVGLVLVGRWMRSRDPKNAFLRFAVRTTSAGQRLAASPRHLPPLIGWTILASAFQVAVFTLLFLAFRPTAPVAAIIAGVPLFLLSFAIAVVPGHVGTYEAAFVAVFALFGFDPVDLALLAIAVHVCTIAIVVILGSLGAALHVVTPNVAPRPIAEGGAPPA